jgi:hypothetical protein
VLWGKESAWNPKADNPNSTAFGIAQMLGEDSTNPYVQISNGLRYIEHRYSNPCAACLKKETICSIVSSIPKNSEKAGYLLLILFEKYFLQHQQNLNQTLLSLQKNLVGTYALAIVLANKPNIIIFAKQGSPMVIGKGLNSNFIASDYYGIACHTNQIMMLEDGDFGYISAFRSRC